MNDDRLVRVRYRTETPVPAGRVILAAPSPSLFPLLPLMMIGDAKSASFGLSGFFVGGEACAVEGEMRTLTVELGGTSCKGAKVWMPSTTLELHVGHAFPRERIAFDVTLLCREIFAPLDVLTSHPNAEEMLRTVQALDYMPVTYDARVRVR